VTASPRGVLTQSLVPPPLSCAVGVQLNHYQYFATMGPPSAGRARAGPGGDLGAAIVETFGSFDEFRDVFTRSALALFGSGFVYLVRDRASGGQLAVKQYPNQDTPVMDGELPIVGLDVWEHAYVSPPPPWAPFCTRDGRRVPPSTCPPGSMR
jgi:superoxide dismutase